jgi:hypothetical protein
MIGILQRSGRARRQAFENIWSTMSQEEERERGSPLPTPSSFHHLLLGTTNTAASRHWGLA